MQPKFGNPNGKAEVKGKYYLLVHTLDTGTDRKSKYQKTVRKWNRRNKDTKISFEFRAFLAMGEAVSFDKQ